MAQETSPRANTARTKGRPIMNSGSCRRKTLRVLTNLMRAMKDDMDMAKKGRFAMDDPSSGIVRKTLDVASPIRY